MRGHEVDLDVGAGIRDRAQVAPPAGDGIVGEDVVDLVDRGLLATEPAHVRGAALPARGRGDRLVADGVGLVGVVLVLVAVVVILGEAEVDESPVPCIAYGHVALFRPPGTKSCAGV